MVHGKNRIPYRIDRRLTGLAGPDYDAPISFGLPLEPEDSQYGKSRLKAVRFALIALPGRVMRHARKLIIRLARGHPSYELLIRARQRILALSAEPYQP